MWMFHQNCWNRFGEESIVIVIWKFCNFRIFVYASQFELCVECKWRQQFNNYSRETYSTVQQFRVLFWSLMFTVENSAGVCLLVLCFKLAIGREIKAILKSKCAWCFKLGIYLMLANNFKWWKIVIWEL